jgi:hypothetical protein
MSRYFFHLDETTAVSRDTTGLECANLEEAIEFAHEIASQLRERNPIARLFERYVLICDEAGNEVKRIPVIPGWGVVQ